MIHGEKMLLIVGLNVSIPALMARAGRPPLQVSLFNDVVVGIPMGARVIAVPEVSPFVSSFLHCMAALRI